MSESTVVMDWEALLAGEPRYDLTSAELEAIYDLPLPRLLWLAQSVHRQNFADDEVQLCTLLSIKTGGCKEDCSYCPQSAHYNTNLENTPFARCRGC